ncbi:hypothetical protein POM88_025933 [Heracleum sosnowskyi]|uniref:Uncharacterized protein n=1 Tax=Heracleum sosnowskyi TaxID=360622 RepID=A0AAD8MNL7_9APIA|nr:hypothetical protein POM88_025933 [Heracleum sosnowskyi]
MVIRANILPKMTPNKMFSFVELKLMYLLHARRVYFSLPYVILVNMMHASKASFMPYGSIKAPVPLEEYEIVQENHIGLLGSISDMSALCARVDQLTEDIKNMKIELEKMSAKNEQLTARVDFLMASLADGMARMNVMEHNINQLVQVQYEITYTPALDGDTGERDDANKTVNAPGGKVDVKIEK